MSNRSRFLPIILSILSVCLISRTAAAQIAFTTSELPAVAGDYVEEYVTTNANPSAMIGSIGGPQIWDFSQAAQPEDLTRRMDIVVATDGGYQTNFPQAAYAERYTDEPANVIEWDYYAISTAAGRDYFGSATPSTGPSAFSPSPVDIPEKVGYGTNWTYTTTTSYSVITEQDDITAVADAYGTVILPNLGAFPALRVNQLTTTEVFLGGTLFETTYLREFYWLVPGFDKAVHIVSTVSTSLPPDNFTSASEIRRVFAQYTVPTSLTPVNGLHLVITNELALLSWPAATNISTYQIEALGNFAGTNWLILASPSVNSWSEMLTPTQRMYRVFAKP